MYLHGVAALVLLWTDKLLHLSTHKPCGRPEHVQYSLAARLDARSVILPFYLLAKCIETLGLPALALCHPAASI